MDPNNTIVIEQPFKQSTIQDSFNEFQMERKKLRDAKRALKDHLEADEDYVALLDEVKSARECANARKKALMMTATMLKISQSVEEKAKEVKGLRENLADDIIISKARGDQLSLFDPVSHEEVEIKLDVKFK